MIVHVLILHHFHLRTCTYQYACIVMLNITSVLFFRFRFRMRYCPCTNGYYLHWDKKVGQHLTRVKGLENGVHNMYGIQRVADGDMVRQLIGGLYQY